MLATKFHIFYILSNPEQNIRGCHNQDTAFGGLNLLFCASSSGTFHRISAIACSLSL
jgi:hypothetical protein